MNVVINYKYVILNFSECLTLSINKAYSDISISMTNYEPSVCIQGNSRWSHAAKNFKMLRSCKRPTRGVCKR